MEAPTPEATATTPALPATEPAPTEAPTRLWELSDETPLHRAAFDGDAEAVADLLDRGADVGALASAYNTEERYSVDSLTPQHLAAWDNPDPAVAALLVDRGADINGEAKVARRGSTPLHLAVGGYPSPAVAELLMDRGADVNAKNEDGETPCDVAGYHVFSTSPTVYGRLCVSQ